MARHGIRGRHKAAPIRRLHTAAPVEPSVPDPEYLVLAGDTFSSIARAHHIPTAKLLAMNGLSWSSGLTPGQRLAVPAGSSPVAAPAHGEITRHRIRSGETVSAIAAQYGITRSAILSANGLHPTSLIFIGQMLSIPAVSVDTQATAVVRAG